MSNALAKKDIYRKKKMKWGQIERRRINFKSVDTPAASDTENGR